MAPYATRPEDRTGAVAEAGPIGALRNELRPKEKSRTMKLKQILRNLIGRILGPPRQDVPPPVPGPPYEDNSSRAGPIPPGSSFPPGLRPVLVKQEDAQIGGIPELTFRRREVSLRDENNAKYTQFETNPIILRGCGCMVTSPREVAYISNISGLPVCRRCAAKCVCGHKTAPNERVHIPDQGYLCTGCYMVLIKQQRKGRVVNLLFGSFFRRD